MLVGFVDVDARDVEQRVERGLLVRERVAVQPRTLADAPFENRGVHADRLAVDQAEPLDLDGVIAQPRLQAQVVVPPSRRSDGEQTLRRRVAMAAYLLGERAQLRAALDEPRRFDERPAPLLPPHEPLLLEVREGLDGSSAADAVLAHQLRLTRDAVAGEQGAGADIVGDLLGQLNVDRTIAPRTGDVRRTGHAVDRAS